MVNFTPSKDLTTPRLLLRKLYARLELRNCDGSPVSFAFAILPSQRVRILNGPAGRDVFPPAVPDGIERSGFVAADGQMGQIIKVYLDWQLSAIASS